ncbi:MAG: response regulator [Candidatus Zixiibacteriota bacterium]
MFTLAIAILYPIIALLLSAFIIYRLKIGQDKESGSAGYVYSGLIFIIIFTLINLFQNHPEYSIWFLNPVYTWIEAGKFVILAAGVILFVVGLALHFNYWGDRDLEVSNHLEKLKLLDSLQQDSRYPFPMTELLDRVLKGLLGGLEEQAGAAFLLNRAQRKFLLVTGSGLSKEETALLEYYPYGRNLVSQAIEDETPMISSDFRSLGGKAQLAASRFHSIIVIPLISGRSKLGALLFFSEEEKHYSREFISILTPIADWLAEKIEVSMLTRDMRKSQELLDVKERQLSGFVKKLEKVFKSDDDITSPADFAERCIGLAGADEAWLVGLAGGRLVFHGGTGNRTDLSDNFKAAMINALSQRKAVILNQEGSDEEGRAYIARASLLIPADSHGNALMLRNNSGSIRLGSEDLKALEVIAAAGGIVVAKAITGAVGISRIKGLKLISEILQLKIDRTDPARSVISIMPQVAGVLSAGSLLVIFQRLEDGYKAVYCNAADDAWQEIIIDSGEGAVGRAAALRMEYVQFDTASVAEMLSGYPEENRSRLYSLFGERKVPSFHGCYPITIGENVELIIDIYGFGDQSTAGREEHQLISLLNGLLNLRFGILKSTEQKPAPEIPVAEGVHSADILNDLNNDLLAISGYCQLASHDPNLSGTAASSFEEILGLTEKMAAIFKTMAAAPRVGDSISGHPVDLNQVIRDLFKRNAISGNLHMIEGRPFSMHLNLKDIPDLEIAHDDAVNLINELCKSFVTHVGEDEVITINTYGDERFVFLDISRHREKFPPVEPVAGFGIYGPAQNYEGRLSNAGFLQRLSALSGEFAYDRYSKTASYYSLKLPVRPIAGDIGRTVGKPLSILAIDDQAVILDLLAAMCQSLGYMIYTARNGRDGIRIFEDKRPDIVISDLAMPEISGWEVASRVKAIAPETPVIIITGWGVTVDEQKMKQVGVDFLLHKPFRLEQLSQLISKAKISGIKN